MTDKGGNGRRVKGRKHKAQFGTYLSWGGELARMRVASVCFWEPWGKDGLRGARKVTEEVDDLRPRDDLRRPSASSSSVVVPLLGLGRSATKEMLDLRSDEPSQELVLTLVFEPSAALLLSLGKYSALEWVLAARGFSVPGETSESGLRAACFGDSMPEGRGRSMSRKYGTGCL